MDTLPLRDLHASATPSWWPPSPGWWLVFAVIVLAAAFIAWWMRRRRRKHAMIARIFDDTIAAASTPAARIAAMSELLRRASRRRDPAADRLQGEEWLRFLDAGNTSQPFTDGAGKLLAEGGYRRDVDPLEAQTVEALARARFLEWMSA